MYKQPRQLILATAVALAITGISSAVAADSSAQDLLEARQESQIWTTYVLSPYLRAHDLKVSVDNGKATLTGVVDEGVNKELANEIALGVDGIQDVDNQIMVQADYVPTPSSSGRTFGDVVNDSAMTTAIKSKLLWSKYTDSLMTTVDTKAGQVTLQGTASNPAAKDLATRLAMNTHGVVSVNNQLVIDGKPTIEQSAQNTAKDAQLDIKDSWITARVKSTLMYSSNVDGSRIEVNTHSGIVTLSGRVESGAERALAIELSENVRGVKSVNDKGLVF